VVWSSQCICLYFRWVRWLVIDKAGKFNLADEGKDLNEKIRWLLLLRVVILSFFLGATALVHFLQAESDTKYLINLSLPLILAYAISIGSALLLPRLKHLRPFAHGQVALDIVLITGIIWITGDDSSPFSFLYNLAVINAAILLYYQGAFIAAGVSSGSYAALTLWSHYLLQTGNTIPLPLPWNAVVTMVINIGSFFAIAALSGYLAQKLGEAQKLLKEKQIDFQELDAFKDALLQGIGSGVAITDSEGRINYFNQQAQSLTSLNEAAVMGKPFDQIFPGLKFDFHRNDRLSAVFSQELPLTGLQGLQKQMRLTLTPLSDSKELLLGYVSIFEDITKQKQIEEKVRIEEELRRSRECDLQVPSKGNADAPFRFDGVVGKSGGIGKIYQLIQKVSASNTNVLISGESGTGKELVARAIHLNGPRQNKPFVAVNCGAIPETLIESELFGHIRGAFTGAVTDHSGLFKQADQGTIFLDEVSELPLHLQVKLLRVLQEKTFTPVGGSKQVKVDVRVISATNRDLRKELEVGRFREDLFYRLNVVNMVLPPLRSRKEDIPALAQYFLLKFATSHSKSVEEISSGVLMQLMNHKYPGNVRELENIIEHALAVTTKNIITEEDLPQEVRAVPISDNGKAFHESAEEAAQMFFDKGLTLDVELETHEKCILLGALKRANGVQKKAAVILGINYRSLRHRLEKYDLLGTKNSDQSIDFE
jgi:two-component system, NtrC family, response regulator PilR